MDSQLHDSETTVQKLQLATKTASALYFSGSLQSWKLESWIVYPCFVVQCFVSAEAKKNNKSLLK